MSCKSCYTFSGNPCRICRTCERLKSLITVDKLGLDQEELALAILRECVGRIQDLVEAHGERGGSPAVDTGSPLVKQEEVPESGEKDKEEEADKGKESKKKKKDKNKDKDKSGAKKDKKKRERSRSKEEPSGDGEAPVPKEATRPKKQKEEGLSPERGITSPPRGNPGGRSSGSGIHRAGVEEDEIQDRVDAFVTNNPASFALGTLPNRRDSHHHGGEEISGYGERWHPREPGYPPARRREEDEESQEIPRRRVPKPRKNKGAAHRARGCFFRRGSRR